MKSKVVILGVNHAYQLVCKECQPAAYRAFMNRVKPDGIGIERAPENFIRNHYYEFTYEQQNICVPYAIENGLQIHPFDWNNSSDDQMLAWDTGNIEEPPLVREKNHYNDFTFFPQLEESFFYSERFDIKEKIQSWMENHLPNQGDFPRRLFLYRTYMQAMRIKQIAKQYSGKTLLIVVGHMHKPDIEDMLKSENDVEIIQPSVYGYPDKHEIIENQKLEDFMAIASFNLLGVQRYYETDINWLAEVTENLNKLKPSFETNVFTLLVNQHQYSNEELIFHYTNIHNKVPNELTFTYTGVVNNNRLDSYFNPFANLSIKSYLKLLIATEYLKSGNSIKAEEFKNELLNEEKLNAQQKIQFEAYWQRFVQKKI